MEAAKPPTDLARVHYDARRVTLESAILSLDARSSRLSLLRGLTFVAAAVAGGYALFRPVPIALGIVGAAIGAGFIAFVVTHALLLTDKARLEQRAAWIRRALLRMDGDVKGAPTGAAYAPKQHAYAGDLDIFGEASFFQRVTTCETPLGEATLAAWLQAQAQVEVVRARQAAVQDLATRHALREDLAHEGHSARGDAKPETGPDRFAAWATPNARPPLGGRAIVSVARVLIVVTLVSAIASSVVGTALGPLRWLWVVTLFAQVAIRLSLREDIDPMIAAVTSREAPFGRYRLLLERLETESFEAPMLAAIASSLRGGGRDGQEMSASREMRSFERIANLSDLRHNGIIHFLADVTLLWDVWCAIALERWRNRAGRRVEAWLAALGEVEALSSFATLAFEFPDYVLPDLAEDDPCFEAKGLSHPLLPAATRIRNDVAMGGAISPRALLITGSNMSGKSTLLRAVGVNSVLALAGAPVCATALRISVLDIHTSMRVEDSLERGVSHFYAELERLKAVVDAADRGARVLFLLDEVMHGTNSRERQIGAKSVIRHLVKHGAIGAATSHDLGLSALEKESAGSIVNVHFEEQVEDGKMTFDYRLKPGPVTTANALRLMAMVGLPVREDD